jgi:hypothetical protein
MSSMARRPGKPPQDTQSAAISEKRIGVSYPAKLTVDFSVVRHIHQGLPRPRWATTE